MYGPDFAEIYQHVYELRGKDYGKESAEVADVIRARSPQAGALLDIACGTGGHLHFFRDMFDHVEGLELTESMLAVARERLPGIALHQGNMSEFDLGRTFDAVTCMFTAIAHLDTVADLDAALRCFARHLKPGGVVAFDPWWFPDRLIEGYISADVIEPDGKTIARVSHTRREGPASRLDVHYVVATPDEGIRSFAETYHHTLFAYEDYANALDRAGFKAEYIDGIQGGRGLFVGVLETAPEP